jgi:Zn-dependent protease with chaperone function
LAATPPLEVSPLIRKLAKPTAAYRRQAWMAVAGLLLFVLLYFGLAGWFGFTAYRLTWGAESGSKNAFWGWLIGACAAFLSVFMLKAVFFIKHGDTPDSVELLPGQHPELFRFLHLLADKAGAPRPHRVFASPRVNAAVFYDLSVLNLFFPSRKNLEIGLGLVNALTLGEFRAVLAHEFGHFAQRAMAVGRWVYVAQQIAAQLVARRDKLDAFLRGLSQMDVRVAWVGWILNAIVWSIRSLVDSAFQLVVLMQRALSREMEMNADLVAVSLTGSDALIHALHRLQAADEAWGRAMAFVMGQQAEGKLTPDLFLIQSEVVAQMGLLLNDARYGEAPAFSGFSPAAHRVFKAELAQPPQMWLTHPLNHEREANAKRHYVSAPIDGRSAWALFGDAQALREQVTAKMLAPAQEARFKEMTRVTAQESRQALHKQFDREYFSSRYRGVYFRRSIVRHARDVESLYDEGTSRVDPLGLDRLYPASLSADMERLRALETEVAQLRALHAGVLQPAGGVIQHRGKGIQRRQLGDALSAVERELADARNHLQAHDRRCRSLHLAVARQFAGAWPAHLRGLLAVLHYADHTEDNLRDLQGLLRNTVNVATATRRVSDAGIQRILRDGNALRDALDKVFAQSMQLKLDEALLQRLGAPRWADALGALKLPGVDRSNLGDWLGAVDGWVDHTAACCGALHSHALEQLLLTESSLAGHLRAGTQPAAAPAACEVPTGYDTLCLGEERKRQTRLGWWARFQTADGFLPAVARVLVAGSVVGAVLGMGASVGQVSVSVYNGLARPVLVGLGGAAPVRVGPFASVTRELPADAHVKVEARTAEGALIEQFEADARGSFGQFIYNVAGASPLVEYTVTYGNAAHRPERLLGAPRWTNSAADTLFTDPPKSISSKTGGGTREALHGLGGEPVGRQLAFLATETEMGRVATAHARWDPLASPEAAEWIAAMAQLAPQEKSVFSARLAEAPDDVVLLRLEQDLASPAERPAVCARHREQAAAQPRNVDWQYLTVRCLGEERAKNQAFIAGYERHPENGWFAYAAGYSEAQNAHWPAALAAFESARKKVPFLAGQVAVDIARVRRLVQTDSAAAIAELSAQSDQLRRLIALESGQGVQDPVGQAYGELARGQLARAVQLSQERPESQARVLRLAAASDGATGTMLMKALALPADQGVDQSTVWSGLALAARAVNDLAPLQQAARRLAPERAEQMLRLVAALQQGQPVEQAQRLMDGLDPELRGHGYVMGVIMLGAKAPKAWRDAAKRLLFVSERPYLG